MNAGRRFLPVSIGILGGSAAGYIYAKKQNSSTNAPPRSEKWQDNASTKSFFEKTFGNVKPVYGATALDLKPTREWDDNWDRRKPENLVKPLKSDSEEEKAKWDEKVKEKKPKARRHLLFIRHGQYNLKGESDAERILTSLGHQQALDTGKRLKELNLPYTSLVVSTMSRAQETAENIAKTFPELPQKSCDFLREGAPYPPEPPTSHWRPEMKQFHQDGARIEAAFRKYFHRADPEQDKDSYEVIVCHANVIRYFVCRALQFPPEAWLRLSLHHASITHLVISPEGRVSMKSLGDAGHIPPERLTFS